MKRITLVVLLVAVSVLAKSQNLQLHYDFSSDRNYLTSTIEKFAPDAYGSTFFFVDFNYGDNGPIEAYWEIARELKKWNGPISIHVEYNGGLGTGFSINNAYLLGGTYSWNAADFTKGVSFSAMYKHIQKNDEPHNFQLTTVWYLHLLNNKVSFTGFADFWKENHTVSNDGFVADFQEVNYVFLTEPQLWYNFNQKFSLGTEVELSYNFGTMPGFNVFPTMGAKWTFN